MKVGAKQLFEIVREIVKEEIERSVPRIVEKHLTEAYIKKVVLESSFANKDNDIDEIPRPSKREDTGIYQDIPPKNIRESVKRKLAEELGENLGFVFEGVQVPDEVESSSIPMDTIEKIAPGLNLPDFSRMRSILEKSSSKKEVDVNQKVKELEMKRQMLDQRTIL